MTTVALVALLLLHGLLHLAIWLPRPDMAEERPDPPFHPDRSAVLERSLPEVRPGQVAVLLASVCTAAYLVAGVSVTLGSRWAVPTALVAGVTGLVLKGLYFHPLLSLGILIDAAVLTSALAQWPLALV